MLIFEALEGETQKNDERHKGNKQSLHESKVKSCEIQDQAFNGQVISE